MGAGAQASDLIFVERHAHHRDLHSFPTRRSSDLRRTAQSRAQRRSRTSRVSRQRPNSPTPSASGCCCTTGASSSRCSRSEEHTSELQSRLHLVCRLLLEKKKSMVCMLAHIAETTD